MRQWESLRRYNKMCQDMSPTTEGIEDGNVSNFDLGEDVLRRINPRSARAQNVDAMVE